MASIEHIDVETGATIYMIVEKVSDNTVRDVVAHDWDTYAVADLINGDYSVTVDETPDDSYRYLATFPTVAAGDYLVKFYRRAGGAPAVADLLVGSGTVHWSGTAISPVLNTGIVNVANGTVEADATYVMGTILTEGAGGQLAGGVIKFFDKASPTGTVNSLPDKVAGATDGLFIAGTNAATTITSAGGNALTLSSTGSNGAGLVVLGNGAGDGITVLGGATGNGLEVAGGETSGSAVKIWAKGTNDVGLEIIGIGTGAGLKIDAGATGIGVDINATAGSAADLTTAAGSALKLSGTTHGIEVAASAGTGVEIDGTLFGLDIAASNGPGVVVAGTTFGLHLDASAGTGFHTSGADYAIEAIANSGTALFLTGADHGIRCVATAGPGIEIDGTTFGIDCVASNGPGALFQGTTYGVSAQATAGTGIYAYGQDSNGHGLHVKGDATGGGTGSGFYAEGGAVAPGIKAKGGTTSGAGFYASATANNDAGMELVKHGTGSDIDADALAAISDDWTDGGRLDLLLDALPTTGSGAVAVDHDYGGAGTLTVKTGGGVGIDGVTIQAYTKANWDAGNVSSAYIVAETTTDVNGEFESPLMLDAGTTYTLNYFLQGEYGANQEEVTVT